MKTEQIRNLRYLFRALRHRLGIEDNLNLSQTSPAAEAAFVRRITEFTPCVCGYRKDPCDKFCGHCGVLNPDFSEFDFMLEFDYSFEEELNLCREGHLEEKNDIGRQDEWTEKTRENYTEFPYCSACGEFVGVPKQ